ncbi:MAG: hypothetical protein ACLTZW_03845 [Paratractidigestivibacter faecalis]
MQQNYTPYDGDESFLAEPTDATRNLGRLAELQRNAPGAACSTVKPIVSSITAYPAAYLDLNI